MLSRPTNELLHEGEAADYLKVSRSRLQRWRCAGGGPRFVRVGGPKGRAVRYRKADLDDYIAENLIDVMPNAVARTREWFA